ncbi:30S ribosomal protein S17 [bacterium]|nr:30S ribosomal protein S17 [bacterium]|tara:strand:- start:627 stop:884 length:258 start_codon:yes stop_codon:yes gene_type:complete
MSEKKTTKRQTLSGTVIKKSGDKTVSVVISRVVVHPLYGKRRTVTKKYLAHDEKNEVEVGSTVTIAATRPRSARKRWEVVTGEEK